MTLIKPGNKAKFLIPLIKQSHAGQYVCLCHKPPNWAEKSDTLELVVTGYFSTKPTLSALTSLLVTSGENMILQCASRERYDNFILTKENEKFSMPQDSQHINSTGKFQALFHISPVKVIHRGTIRCYGYKNSTYVWSKPSDSLEIHITVLQAGLYQAKFIKSNVTFIDGGIYKCYGSEDTLPYLSSYPSYPVELVVSGSFEDPDSSSQEPIPTSAILPKPAIRAEPGSVVAEGSQVTIICEGTSDAQGYYLYHYRNLVSLRRMTLMKPGNKAKFLIPLIKQSHAGQYVCLCHKPSSWPEKSDTLELVVTGAFSKPRLSAQPSPVLAPGGNVTLQCVSKQQYDRFILIKEGPQKLSWIMDSQYNQSSGQFEALFSVGFLTPNQLWTFRCYSNYRNKPQVWSESSEPLELSFSGIYYNKPSLSVLPSPVVTSGGNMTLKCVSQEEYDKFILTKEGQKFLSSMNSQYIHSIRQYQAFFSIDHVTPDHTGTFRCYGYYKSTPRLWSVPSDPLEIHISGESAPSLLPHQGHILGPGKTLTLQFCSGVNYERFDL
ncbi:leukocyte immunoglobulin-like receptor subfamily B member 3-like [Peromyscus californicus insignis]|uniref:leukocyte immunoglobulin-like receptor subfamily B member 3-like n=1 Tax=Peromyscus californicus insignis TaxID=564181 RepID=UPI0022A6B25D|nr:leukocyte immunoglobulin-like receptor subfamily B member 3-like [Peromyscus californicus insignis]